MLFANLLVLFLAIRIMPKARGVEWNYVESSGMDKSGNHLLKCKYCSSSYKGTASKIRLHLLSCSAVPASIAHEIRSISDVRDILNKNAASARRNFARNDFSKQLTIKKMQDTGKQTACDETIASFFFEAGLPLAMVNALKAASLSYVPPYSNRLEGLLLDKLHQQALTDLSAFVETYVTLCSDGWSTLDDRKIVNFVIGNPERCAYVKCLDYSGIACTADFIFEQIKAVVEELAGKKITVAAVATYTAANMHAARERLEEELGLISIPCLCHVLDLMIEDVAKC